jgi:hypothetical protein
MSDEEFDSFPAMNLDECDGPIERKPFTFQYEEIAVWSGGECIVESVAFGELEAVSQGEGLQVSIEEALVRDYLLEDFEFRQISENIDRVIWSNDILNPAGEDSLGVPSLMSLFYKGRQLAKVSLTVNRPDVLIEFFGSEMVDESHEELGMDLSNFFFMSSDHIRYQGGQQASGHNLGCYRGITVSAKTDSEGLYSVGILKQDSPHPVWNDNYTMVPKIMEIVEQSGDKIVLRGVGFDDYGSPYGDYGITIELKDGEATRVVLHMLDRGVNIFYMP